MSTADAGCYTVPRECVCGESHLDRATYWAHRLEAEAKPAPSVAELLAEQDAAERAALALLAQHADNLTTTDYDVRRSAIYGGLIRWGTRGLAA